jgi:uncharacterized membrane protein
MLKIYKEMILCTIIFVVLDIIFITINKTAFENQVISVQRVVMQVKPIGAIICYLLLIFGLFYFIISRNRPLIEAFFFGVVIYGVYDSTNYAMFKKWDPYLAIMDTLWGGVLMTLTTYLTYTLSSL